MDFFDNVLNKAKDVYGVAKKKTTEAYNVGKQKYDIASMENKLAKSYEALGIVCYENFADSENISDEVKALISQISREKEEIEVAREQLLRIKNQRVCPKCGSAVADESVFCNHCGEKLIFSEE